MALELGHQELETPVMRVQAVIGQVQAWGVGASEITLVIYIANVIYDNLFK